MDNGGKEVGADGVIASPDELADGVTYTVFVHDNRWTR
jgi:hypothetical protein